MEEAKKDPCYVCGATPAWAPASKIYVRSTGRAIPVSDDGRCVDDSLLMRRALSYVKAFDGVVAQHSQDPRLAGPGACCHESEWSGRLGLPGWWVERDRKHVVLLPGPPAEMTHMWEQHVAPALEATADAILVSRTLIVSNRLPVTLPAKPTLRWSKPALKMSWRKAPTPTVKSPPSKRPMLPLKSAPVWMRNWA